MKVVGTNAPKYDGLAHATGQTQYTNDVSYPGMLWVKAYRSPFAKAKITHVDTSKAEKIPGVAAIIIAKDIPKNPGGYYPQIIMADKAVSFKGVPIAAVAAVDEETAQAAVDMIDVGFEEETPVFDPIEAMNPDAPKVRPEGNIWMFGDSTCRRIRLGNVEQGFKESDVIVKQVYHIQNQDQCPLETQCSIAHVDAKGHIVINSTGQMPHAYTVWLSDILQVPSRKVRILGGTVGGGFGGKQEPHSEPITAVLAMKTNRPVKWVWTREEELIASSSSGAWVTEYEDGVKKDGRIIARKIKVIRDSGAYPVLNPYAIDKHCTIATGPYFIPNVWIDGYNVLTNKQPAGPIRGYGTSPACYAHEVQMEKIAEAVGKDSWEIRFINAYREGDISPINKKLESVSGIETMKAAAEAAGIKLSEKLMAMTSDAREV